MSNEDKIIDELIGSIEYYVNAFQKDIPAIQKEILKKVLRLSEDFYIPAKTVKQQADNLKLISRIKAELNSVILTDNYSDSVKEFVKGFDHVAKIQNAYFSTVFSESVASSALLKQIKKTSIDLTVDKLSGDGMVAGLGDKVRDILNRNISTGGSYSELVGEMRKFLTDREGVEGALTRYTKQITNDSLNQFSAQYTQAVTEDLGLEWFKYVGSLVKGSRPFCKALIEAKAGCMPYIHKSQLNAIASGHICGSIVSKAGLYPITDGSNLQLLRGGYNCGHQLMPVSEFIVPEELRKKFA